MDKVLGVFNYLNNIDDNDKIIYISILIFSVFFSTSVINGDVKHILGLLIGFAIILFLNDKKLSEKTDLNRELEVKLNLLHKKIPLYFHLDPDMINLFFSIKDFKKYNPDAFIKAMETTDNVLHLKSDFEQTLMNPVETFETAQMMANKSLNYMQSFIISVPKNKVYNDKFQTVLKRHHLLLKRNLDFMFERSKELTKDIDTSTKFITDYNRQKPYNPSLFKFGLSNFDLFN